MTTAEADRAAAMPWSAEAEQSFLGGLLLDPDALLRTAGRCPEPAQFFDHRHRAIMAAILELAARHLPVDVITTCERLQSMGKLEECGGLPYLNALAQSVPSASNVARYAEIVSEKATRRAIIAAADKAMEIARDPGGEADGILDRVASLFGRIQVAKSAQAPRQLGELVSSRLEHWQSLSVGETQSGFATGLPTLDAALGGGLKPGKVVVLAARPSVGKTSLAGQILLNVAGQGHRVLMLSQEMAAGDLVDRAVSNLGRINLDRLTTGQFEGCDWSNLVNAADSAARLPFFIDDQPALGLLDIRAKARQVQQRGGLALLAVDYLQLCTSGSRSDRRHHQIEEISRGLKSLAKELGVCVLVLSQLTRESDRDEPELSHLKESGAIEEDADVVIMLHPMGNEPDGSLLILAKIPKNRQGRRGRLALAFYGRTQRWIESASNVSRRRGREATA